MCELTVANLGLKRLNLLYMTQQLMRNSQDHPDGTGVWNSHKLWKTYRQALLTPDVGDILSGFVDHRITMGHVRKASTAHLAKGITVDNAHPFSGERFIFAHNGTMETVFYTDMQKPQYVGKIDSAIFHSMLEETAAENPKMEIVELLNKVYNNWTGKFAFLLYDKKLKKFFAVRGETATLFSASINMVNSSGELVQSGYVINTERQHLVQGLVSFSNVAQFSTGLRILWPKEDLIQELPKNTIFELTPADIFRIGEIKETKKSTTATTTSIPTTTVTTGYASNRSSGVNSSVNSQHPRERIATIVAEFITKWRINIEYFDMMCFLYFGKGVQDLSLAEINSLVAMIKFYDNTTIKHKKLRNGWESIMESYNISALNVHRKTNLTFPYMKEVSTKAFDTARELLIAEKNKKSGK